MKVDRDPQLTVYFAGAIKGDTSYAFAQQAIIRALKASSSADRAVRVFSELSPDVRPMIEGKSPTHVFRRDRDWLMSSDALVAEVSGESFGVGWEIAFAQEVLGIPVLCLVYEGATAPVIAYGNTHKGIQLKCYRNEAEIRDRIEDFIRQVESRRNQEEPPAGGPEESRHPVRVSAGFEEITAKISQRNLLVKVTGMLPNRSRDRDADLNDALRRVASSQLGGVSRTGIDDPASSFKAIARVLEGRGPPEERTSRSITVFVAEASSPSTDLGWFVCYAQWKNCPVILAARHDANLSWMILGQLPSPLGTDDTSAWTMLMDEDEPVGQWRPARPAVRDSRHKYRPRILLVRYASPADLAVELDRRFTFIARQHQSMTGRTLHHFLGEPQAAAPAVVPLEFYSESALRQILWNSRVTRNGIEGSFVRGELARLVPLLYSVTPCPSPSVLHFRVRLAVNYEEKALAKNVRALKDVGILQRRDRKAAVRDPAVTEQLALSGAPAKQDLAQLPPTKTFVRDAIVLSPFGQELSLFLREREDVAHRYDKFLRDVQSELGDLVNPDQLNELLNNSGYLLRALDAETRHTVMEVVAKHDPQRGVEGHTS